MARIKKYRSKPSFKSTVRRVIKKASNQTNDKTPISNDYIIVLNGMPIECNKDFIISNFYQLYTTRDTSDDFSPDENTLIIQIDKGDAFYEVTKCIFQGTNYEITDDNFDYLVQLSQKIQCSPLQTKLNSFCYKRECDDNQIDQHPSIQFLIEFSSLIKKLSLTNYEDISSQIKEKLIFSSKKSMENKETDQKSSKKKSKKRKQKSNEENEENEPNDEEIKEVNEISLNKISKKTLSKIFYYSLVNTLSSNFHSAEIFKEHQNKIDLIIQLIKELDSKSKEENADYYENDTYLKNFVSYVLEKFENDDLFIRETNFICNYLYLNKLLEIDIHQLEMEDDLEEYFLHLFPPKAIRKYFKNNFYLLRDDDSKKRESNYERIRKGIEETGQRNNPFKNKINLYLQDHQMKIEQGFSFDDEITNIIINDDLDQFISYLLKEVNEANKENKKNKASKDIDENTIINRYSFPDEISKYSCISILNQCSMLELAAFFGSDNIFDYLNIKRMKNEIYESSNLLSFIIASENTKIIEIYLNSFIELNNNKNNKIEEEIKKENKEESEDQSNSDFDSDIQSDFSNDDDDSDILSDLSNDYIKQMMDKINKMILLSIDLGSYDCYKFLNEYALSINNEELSFNIDCKELDNYMKRCVSRGYFDMIPLLLKEGANTNVLLNLFCKNNNEIGIEYMLEFSNIDVNTPYKGLTPLEYCINNKNCRTSLLLLHNDKIDLQNFLKIDFPKWDKRTPPIFTIFQSGLSKVVDYFLHENLFDINIKSPEGFHAIHLVCQSGDFEMVSTIVDEMKKKVKINGKVTKGPYKGFTPLHFACISGNSQIVTLLLDRYKSNIKINLKDATKKWTPLQYAVFNGHSEIVSILLNQEGIETDTVTEEKETLLHLACMSNKEEIVDMLINNKDISTKFDLNERTLNERTPLQIALSKGNCNMINFLLNIDQKGSKKKKKQSDLDPNMLSNNGQAPLIIACEMKRIDIFKLLLQHSKIDVNIKLLSTGKTALYIACELNLTEIIELLLSQKDIDVNARTKLGKTPLIAACEKGNKEAVELLIKYNDSKSVKNNRKTKNNLIDFDAKTTDGKTALLISCEYLKMDIAEMLIHIDGIECDIESDDGKTPLCYACEKNFENMVSDLIDHGANANHQTKNNQTPLYFACLSQNENIVKNILSKIDDFSQINLKETENETTPLFISCQKGNLEIFNLLINELDEETDLNYQDINGKTLLFASCEGEKTEIIHELLTKFNIDPNIPDKSGKNALHVACEMKNAEIVDLIIQNSSHAININEKWNDATPLEIACEKGSIEIVRILLKQDGIQVNPTDKHEVPPLLCACEIWRTDIIKLLLTEVEDIDVDVLQSDRRSALHYSCEKGDTEITSMILSKSAKNINMKTTDKMTPIELACSDGNADVISLLLNHIDDIEINAKFYNGNTILTEACNSENVNIVKYLLENTIIDVNGTNNQSETALHIVANNGNTKICQLLLNHEKIDINITVNGKTALYEACKCGNEGIVELLIKNGANVNCLTKNGKTPLHTACQNGHNKVVSLLLNCPEIDVNLLTKPVHDYKTAYTPLLLACLNNYNGNSLLCVELLLHHPKIDVNITSSENESPLTIACDDQNFDIVNTLLQSPQIDPNVKGSYDNTALHIACEYCKIHLIETLLNNPQIDVNCMNVNNETPISIACNRNNIEIIKLLLKHEDLIVCNSKQENPIRKVIKNNKKELFTILLHHPTFDINGVDVNGVTPLCYSIESQNIDFILQLLLLSTTDVNKKSLTKNLNLRENNYYYYYGNSDEPLKYLTPLSLAVKIGNYQIVKMLIQSPFLDINEYSIGKTALHDSIISDNTKITSLLLSSPKTDPNLITKLDLTSVNLQDEYHVRSILQDSYLMGQSALHIAIQKHDIESIKLLLKREDLLVNEYTSIEDSALTADYKNKYKYECNALYIACNENLPEVVSLLLLRSDIDINATSTKDKLTPLHIAAKKGYLDIVKILLSNEHCNANATSLDGTDILIFACQSENIKLLKMILSIDPEALFTSQTLNGDTPFHFACKTENPKILKILLDEIKDREFDINIRNKKGETPLHFAVKYDVEIDLYKKPKPKKFNEYQYINDYLTKTVFGILIQNGADINASNLYGQTPLHYACMHESYSIIEILLRNPKTLIEGVDQQVIETPLITLISTTLKNNYKKYNDTYRMSVNYRLNSTVNNFLEHGAKYDFIDKNGISLLHFAIICQNYDLFNFFFTKIKNDLVKFLNINSNYGTPIHLAIKNWDQKIMQLLLQKKKEISFDEQDKNEIVYQCSLNGDEKSMILLLLDNENDQNLDFNVNYIDSKKRTPLHISVENDNSIISNILANYDKTNTNLLDKNGKSALHQACSNNNNYSALAILTKIELINLKRMFDADKNFDCNKFNKYLSSQILSSSTINDKIDINLQTKGMTRREFFRKERAKVLQQYPNTTYFNIYYREPRFNIGFTALHISVACHLADVLQKILLYPDLDVNITSEHGDTASSLSAKHWNEEIVEILLKCSRINFNYVPKEEESDSEYDDDGNQKIKDQNDDEDDQNRPPHTLTSEEIQKIKERKRNQNKTILHSACEHNSIKIIKELLTMCKDGIFDINGKDSFDEMAPLHYICQNGNEQILNLFIEFEKNNPDIIDWNIKNKNGMTPLHFAVRNKMTKIVDILINNEIVCPHIDINATATGEFEDGRTPLSFACEKGLLDIVTLLLSDKNNNNEDENDPFSFKKDDEQKVLRGSLCGAKNECDLTIKSKAAHQKGMTALHYACCGSNIDVVKLILNHGGFNINARANGKTCLFLACQHNREEIVKLLLDQKDIDYNLKTPRGMTPLMIASQDGRTKIVEMLLNLRKIDTKALTVDGESARSMAKNSAILNLFDKYA